MNKHEGARPWDAMETSGISAPLRGEPQSCQVPSEADSLEDTAPRRQVRAQLRAQMTALGSTSPGALCTYAQMRAAARASVVHVGRHKKKWSRRVCECVQTPPRLSAANPGYSAAMPALRALQQLVAPRVPSPRFPR